MKELQIVAGSSTQQFKCDLCGAAMLERACNVTCPNGGYRFDCSDLTLNFDQTVEQKHRGLNRGG